MLSYCLVTFNLVIHTLANPITPHDVPQLEYRQTPSTNISTRQLPILSSNPNPPQDYPSDIITASFTWNGYCGETVACGPATAGIQGVGCAAVNTQAYVAGVPMVNGVGAGCGQCWHLQPLSDVYPNPNNLAVGTPIVVKINDHCPDGGYCQQSAEAPLNDYGAAMHFDLCSVTGTAQAFFGQIPPGVLMGVARYNPGCDYLEDGQWGASMGSLV